MNTSGAIDTAGFEENKAKFEATGLLSVAPTRRKRLVSVETDEVFTLAVEEATMESAHSTCSVCAIARQMDLSWSIVYN